MKNGAKTDNSQVNVGQFQKPLNNFAKEGTSLLYGLSSVLIWDYRVQSWHETWLELPGSRDRDCRAAGIGEGYLVMRA